jgi:hypothetical protein
MKARIRLLNRLGYAVFKQSYAKVAYHYQYWKQN